MAKLSFPNVKRSRRSAAMLRRRQGLHDVVWTAAADHLGDAAAVGLATDDAIGAGPAATVGAAAVSFRAL